jgi:hypothetical protein
MPTPLTVEFIGSRVTSLQNADLGDCLAEKVAGGGASVGEQTSSLSVQGGEAIAMDYPTASRFCTLTFDIVSAGGTALDFTSGGTEEGQLLWVWGNALLPLTSTGTNTAGAIGGFGIIVSDNAVGAANSYAGWTFYGSENYPGGFQKMVVDPLVRPTFSGGGFAATDLAAIRKVGVFFVSDALAKGGADACIFDAIDVGSGLRIYGSGTPDAGFKDLIDADEGDINNRYGAIKSLDAASNIVEMQGVLEIGSGVNAQTVFDDINRIVNFGAPQTIDTSVTPQVFNNSIPSTFQKVLFNGNTTSGTIIRMGEKVGAGDTARGRNGCIILGNADYDLALRFNNNGNVDNCLLYGTTIRDFRSELTWLSTPTGHEFIGSTIDGGAEFTADSGVIIRNSTFQNAFDEVLESNPAFRFNSGTNIKNSNFIANEFGIHHPFTGTFIYDNLQFTDNTTADILFSYPTAPGGNLVIQATNGSNPATSSIGTSGQLGNSVTIENTVLLTLTDIVVGSEVRLYKSDPTGVFPVELAGTEAEDDGVFEYAYNFTGNFDTDIVVLNTGYVYFRQNNNTLTNLPNTIKINQVFDRNYENP